MELKKILVKLLVEQVLLQFIMQSFMGGEFYKLNGYQVVSVVNLHDFNPNMFANETTTKKELKLLQLTYK